jgi:levansucrase
LSRDRTSLAGARSDAAGTTAWTAEHVRLITRQELPTSPAISENDFCRVSPTLDIWDAWPLQSRTGTPEPLADGSTLWMALGSPHFSDPDERHGHARIHLLHRRDGEWTSLGPAMPEGFSPGSREWSGSAVLAPGSRDVTLYFTATGRRGEPVLTFEQRIFSATATLADSARGPRLEEWRDLREIVLRDPAHYMASDMGRTEVGAIKAFRDPCFFLDPADDAAYLLFAASAAGSDSDFNGVVGVARADRDSPTGWWTLTPLVSADGLNNELERPHMIVHGGAYYLFWSTQSHVFDPAGPVGPTGLYGMVADCIGGPWRPLNRSGLVFANPPEAPRQAYSWLVLPDLRVISFVDDWGSDRDAGDRRRFGATFAPVLRIALKGDTAHLAR